MSASDHTHINKLIIYYFTGTGNARQVAKWIAEKAKSKSIEAHLINIGKGEANIHNEIAKSKAYSVSLIYGKYWNIWSSISIKSKPIEIHGYDVKIVATRQNRPLL